MTSQPPETGADHRVTLIIPTLNEVENIEPLLKRIFASRTNGPSLEVLFVDDGSTDGTVQKIRDCAGLFPARVLVRDNPLNGLTGAVLEGARLATTTWILIMDADLSHPPERIDALLLPLFAGSAEMAIGSRYVAGGQTLGWPWWRLVMSHVAKALVAPLARVHDPLSGFFAVQRLLLTQINSGAAGFKVSLEILVAAGDLITVAEIPITFVDRERGRSKMSLRVWLIYMRRVAALYMRNFRPAPSSESRSNAVAQSFSSIL